MKIDFTRIHFIEVIILIVSAGIGWMVWNSFVSVPWFVVPIAVAAGLLVLAIERGIRGR